MKTRCGVFRQAPCSGEGPSGRLQACRILPGCLCGTAEWKLKKSLTLTLSLLLLPLVGAGGTASVLPIISSVFDPQRKQSPRGRLRLLETTRGMRLSVEV